MRVIVKLPDRATPGKTTSSLIWSSPPASCLLVSTASSTGPCPGQVVFAKPRQRGGNKISYSTEYVQPFPKGHGFCLAPQEKPCLPTQCSFWNTYSDRTCLGKGISFQPLPGPQSLFSPVSVRPLGRSSLLNSRPHVNNFLGLLEIGLLGCGNTPENYKQASEVKGSPASIHWMPGATTKNISTVGKSPLGAKLPGGEKQWSSQFAEYPMFSFSGDIFNNY